MKGMKNRALAMIMSSMMILTLVPAEVRAGEGSEEEISVASSIDEESTAVESTAEDTDESVVENEETDSSIPEEEVSLDEEVTEEPKLEGGETVEEGAGETEEVSYAYDATVNGIVIRLTTEGVLTMDLEEGATNTATPNYSQWSAIPYAATGTAIKKVIIGEGITTIGNYAFYNTAVEEVEFASTVNTIGQCAFYQCSKLKKIDIPEGVTSLQSNVFRGCTSLEEVSLPSTLTSINTWAFTDDRNIKSITTAEGCAFTAKNGFLLQNNDTEINMYYGPTDGAVVIPEGVTTVSDVFKEKPITSVVFPSTTTSIAYRAFYRCVNLQEVTIPCNLTAKAVF